MRFASRLSLSFLTFLVSSPGVASGESFTLEQVRAIAVRTHPSGLEADALRRLGRAEVSAARTWADPEAELSFGEGRPRDVDAPTRSEFGWSVTQQIPFPLAYARRIKAAQYASLGLEAEGARRRLELLFAVEVAFFDLASSTERLKLVEEGAQDAEKIFRLSSRRAELGEARESERIRAEIELLRQRRALDGVRRDVEALRSILRRLAGPDLPADFEIQPEWPSRALSHEDLRRRLSESNPELAAARAEAARAEQSRSAAKWGVFPDLSAGVFEEKEIDRRARGFSLGISIPLWNANRPSIARARAEESLAKASLRILEIELQNQLDRTLQTFQLAAEQSETFSGRLLPAARESLRLASLAYAEGETSFLELLDAQRTFREAVAEWIGLKREAAASYAELRRLTGAILDEQKD